MRINCAVPANASTARVTRERLSELVAQPDPLAACRAVGDDWISRRGDLALEVPSILVPDETNLILNPAHPAMSDVSIVSVRAFHFDPRLAAARR